MINPILNAMNGSRNNNMINRIAEIRQVLSGQPVEAVYNRMMQTNPQFAQFVRQNQGKSPEQIAGEYGVDPAMLSEILK